MKKSVAIIVSIVCVILIAGLFYLEKNNPAGGKAMLEALRK